MMTFQTVQEALVYLCAQPVCQVVISKPLTGTAEYKKLRLERRSEDFQLEKYTQTQVFHENIQPRELEDTLRKLIPGQYGQVNGKS